MNKKDLSALGLDEDIAQQIIVLHGKDIEKFKAELDTKAGELEALNAQLTEAGQTIESFKAMDVEGIKAAADEWKAKAETAQQEAESKLQAVKFDHALQDALREAKARNAKAVKALLDLEQIKLSDAGELEGFTDQISSIMEENSFLFEQEIETDNDDNEDPEPRIVGRTRNQGVMEDTIVAATRKAAGLT